MKENLAIQNRITNNLLEQNIELLPKFINGIFNSVVERISDEVVQKMMNSQIEQEKSETHENWDQNLTQKEAAKLLKCSTTKLWRLRKERKLKFYMNGRIILYKKRDLDEYINLINNELL